MGRMWGYCVKLPSHSSKLFCNYHLPSHWWQLTSPPRTSSIFSWGKKLLSLSTKRLDWSQWVTSSTGLSFVTDTSFQNWKARNQSGWSYYLAPLSCLRRAAILHICARSTCDFLCQFDWTLVREDICFNISLVISEAVSRCFSPLPFPPSLFFLFSYMSVMCICVHIFVCVSTYMWERCICS